MFFNIFFLFILLLQYQTIVQPPAQNLVQTPQTTASNLVKPIPIKVNANGAQEAILQQKQQKVQQNVQQTNIGSGGISVEVNPSTPNSVGRGGGLLMTSQTITSTPQQPQPKVGWFLVHVIRSLNIIIFSDMAINLNSNLSLSPGGNDE